jgi:hypothetical protein
VAHDAARDVRLPADTPSRDLAMDLVEEGPLDAPAEGGVSDPSGEAGSSDLPFDLGPPATLVIAPTAHDFGLVDVGVPVPPVELTVTNLGADSTGPLAVDLVAEGMATGPPAFTVVADGCSGQTLATERNCVLRVIFTPTVHGQAAATLSVSATPGGQATATLTGTGRDTVALTVVKAGSGDGQVFSVAPASPMLDCGPTCVVAYPRTTQNPVVMLTAQPDLSSSFAGFGGCDPGGDPSQACTVTLDVPRTITATFTARSGDHLVVSQEDRGQAHGTTFARGQSGAFTCADPSCILVFDPGDTVTVTATPDPGFYFGGWSGDCNGFDACQLTLDGDHTVTAHFAPANTVFVTSTTYSLDDLQQRGAGSTAAEQVLSGADQVCAQLAQGAGLAGQHRAWLSSEDASALDRLGSARGWVRVDGLPFADVLIGSQPPGPIFYPPQLDEMGATGRGGADVLTATGDDGRFYPGFDCQDFTSRSPTDLGFTGERSAGSGRWSTYYEFGCDHRFHLYCLGVEETVLVPPPVPPAASRLAFVSHGPLDPAQGLAGADALCQGEAQANGLGARHFLALLATSTQSAAARFMPSGLPVVRTDGVTVSQSDLDFFGGRYTYALAPIDVEADGVTYSTGQAWTGSSDPSLASPGAMYCCDDWSSTADYGLLGAVGSVAFYQQVTFPCGAGATWSVYCVEGP